MRVRKGLVAGVGAFALGGLLHMFTPYLPPALDLAQGLFSAYLYIGITLAWGASVRRRLLPSTLRACAQGSAQVMTAWMLLRCYRYRAALYFATGARYAWYAYYPLLLAIGLLLFWACLSFDGGQEGEASVRRQRLAVAAGVLTAAVGIGFLTNDLHHAAFAFPPGYPEEAPGLPGYVRGPLYVAGMALFAGLLIASALLMLRLRRAPLRRFALAAPLAVCASAIGYLVLYETLLSKLEGPERPIAPYLFPEVLCFSVLLIWEWFIASGLIPSNRGYDAYFARMRTPALIADAQLRPVYATEVSLASTPAQRQLAFAGPVRVGEDALLQAAPLRAGTVFWESDLSAVERLNEELADLTEQLAGQNDLLEAENALEERRARIAAKSQVLDVALSALKERLELLDAQLAQLDAAAPSFDRDLAALSMQLAYVKRAMNLRLVEAQGTPPDLAELALCLEESLRYARRCEVEGAVVRTANVSLGAGEAVALYERFEQALEAVLPEARYVLASLDAEHGTLNLVAEPYAGMNALLASLQAAGFAVEAEGGSAFVRIPLAGGAPHA